MILISRQDAFLLEKRKSIQSLGINKKKEKIMKFHLIKILAAQFKILKSLKPKLKLLFLS